MDDPKEILDLVDENDEVIGKIVRQDILRILDGKDGFVRAANCFVMNDAGLIWIPKRASSKKIAPNGLDFSAGEHVAAGETYEQAAARGCKEELGLEVTASDLKCIGKILPIKGVPYFESIFVCNFNEIPHYNKSDFASYAWISPKNLREMLLSGVPAKKALLPAVELLLF